MTPAARTGLSTLWYPRLRYPFGGHLRQHWYVRIHVIVNQHRALGGVQPMQPAPILGQRPLVLAIKPIRLCRRRMSLHT
jgi:hypothetical protein